jgi:hypothetical protein
MECEAYSPGAATSIFFLSVTVSVKHPSSPLLLAWIAYCVSLLTSDLLNANANDHKKDVEIILLKC